MLRSSTWSDIYSIFKLVLLESQVFGITTFTFSENGIKLSKTKPLYNIITIIVYVLFCLIVISYRIFSDICFLSTTSDIIHYTASLIYLLTIWTNAIINQGKCVKLFEEFINFDLKVKEIIQDVDYKQCQIKNRRCRIIRYILVFITVIGQILTHKMYVTHLLVLMYVVYYLPMIINPIVIALTLTFIYGIKYRIQTINREIFTILYRNQYEKSVKLLSLKNACILYHEITKIIKLTNEIFGITLLLSFTVSFINIVIGFYFFWLSINDPINVTLLLNNMLRCFYYIVETTILCRACQTTIDELKEAAVFLYQIDSTDEYIKDEIELFSIQIANEQVEFCAARFFPINYSLLFSVLFF